MMQKPAELPEGERAKELLARNLDRLMRRAGITQTSLAKRSGIVKTTLNTYFTRKSFPSEAKLLALAAALGVGVDDLVFDTGDASPESAQAGGDAAGAPYYSVSAVPGQPKRSRVVVRAELPTDVALRIMALVTEAGNEES